MLIMLRRIVLMAIGSYVLGRVARRYPRLSFLQALFGVPLRQRAIR